MQYWMISIMNHYGYLGIALLILIENLFPPIPSEVILTFGGFNDLYKYESDWGYSFFYTWQCPWRSCALSDWKSCSGLKT